MASSERVEEALFTGLRLAGGLDVDAVSRRYGIDVRERYWDRLQPFLDGRLLLAEGPVLRLSRNGMLVANEILQVFV